MKPDYIVETVPLGWMCPKCKRIWSPNTNKCIDCEIEDDKAKLSESNEPEELRK